VAKLGSSSQHQRTSKTRLTVAMADFLYADHFAHYLDGTQNLHFPQAFVYHHLLKRFGTHSVDFAAIKGSDPAPYILIRTNTLQI